MTRRTLLLAGLGSAATVAIPKVAVAAGKKVARRTHLERSTWEPLVGTVLETRNPGLPRVPLLLAKIVDSDTSYGHSDKYQERSFTLVFRGPAGQPLADATHRLYVPGVGKVDVWFSSSTLDAEGWSYVAVFANARVRQRPPKKPRAPKGQRAQARERSRKSEKAARHRRRERRRGERERRREERRAREAAGS
ncbi:MAG TPA: hypothetical protein VF712_18010 [Thermoleophilaceae bacterium]|jgi:hypothetical protein